ncbi:MAG: hypothetical protein IKX57_03035 [Oscillospiraceae bacterium]|nr:hypothetical protein [Oscillospiraceae bacterium]MBR5722576.1 hypothetical protein [Oscillospiraceae bacterium]
MKIALNRSDWRFWLLYCILHFGLLAFSLIIFKWLWAQLNSRTCVIDLSEVCFIAAAYALILTFSRLIIYRIGKKRYEKNPVDRRRNNLFRE